MSSPVKFQADAQSIGRGTVNGNTVIQTRAPTSADWNYLLSTTWVDTVGLASYVLVSVVTSEGINTATWNPQSGTSGNFTSLTVVGPTSLSGGTFTVASGTNAINISNDAAATTVNVGTGAGSKTVTVGSTNGASTTTIHGGSGGILVGTNAAAQNITIGNITGATTVDINAGSGGINMTGTLGVSGTIGGEQLFATGDSGGVSSTTALTNINTTSVSSGVGTILMTTTNNANSSAWIKIYIGTTAYYIPCFTTDAP